MEFDLVFVTYNSIKWIDDCFQSIIESEFDLRRVNIVVVDNDSKDGTIEKLHEIKDKYGEKFSSFRFVESKTNLGFGKGNNLGASIGSSEYIFFMNIDTLLHKDTFLEIEKAIQNSQENVAVWELRQIPYEHPKIYNPVTMEVSWISGAAFVVKRNVFELVKGFDPAFFMYAEDVDLSWNIRKNGYKLNYVPRAVITHFSYKEAGEVKPVQYLNSVCNNCLLRAKYGRPADLVWGYIMIFKLFFKKGPFKKSRRLLLMSFVKVQKWIIVKILQRIFSKLFPKKKNKKEKAIINHIGRKFAPKFLGWDYELIRDGAFVKVKRFPDGPKVSILIRTCGRPAVLREALISVKNQTYKNIEVVVVEDGENSSEVMLKNEFSDMNIKYYSTGKKVGRCMAGNKAMELATGKYLNFLDDDDLLYSDHVEILVSELENSSNEGIAYAFAYETPIVVKSREPYIYEEKSYLGIYKQDFNRLVLFHHNYLPIQTVMFKKDIFSELGGLDENFDVLEDWDLWVRYATKYRFINVRKTTSLYRVPFEKKVRESRQKELDEYLKIVLQKFKNEYFVNISPYELREEYEMAVSNNYCFKVSSEVLESINNKIPFAVKLFKLFLRLVKYIGGRFCKID